jgi:alpha-L-fucosidase
MQTPVRRGEYTIARMMRLATLLIFACAGLLVSASQDPRATPASATASPESPARPSRQQLAWHDYEVGMFIHIAPQTWQDSESDSLSTPLSAINPDKLDTDSWVRVAESMGAKYIVFVAKHEGGFCWWQTETTDFGVRQTPWRGGKGDVLADLAASCRKRGMRLGVYLSPQDRKHGVAVGGRAKDPSQQAAYEAMFRRQLTEVLSKYGDMAEVWFDGNLVFDVGDILAAHAPNAVVFQGPQASIRWVGNEDGVAPYPAWNAVNVPSPGVKWGDFTAAQSVFGGARWLPIECDARIRATWFWRTDNAATLKSVDQLMDMYYKCVGHGAVLLLNMTPDRTGLMPEADVRRAEEFGETIRRRLGSTIGEMHGTGAALTLTFKTPTSIQHVVMMENLAGGERVRDYVVEGRVQGRWQPVSSGTAIGHKKIDRIAPTVVDALRLTITRSAGAPDIRRFAAY